MVFDVTSAAGVLSAGQDQKIVSRPFCGDVEEFVGLIINHDLNVASNYLTTLIDDGARLKNIYLDLLAPAARHLGTLWDEDLCNFTQVTVGVARMHQILHMFSPCFCAHEAADPASELSALIVPMPGDQHTFGHIMVVEFFRREGWNVWSGSPSTNQEVLDIVSQQSFNIVGLSIGADRHLGDLKSLLDSIRAHSANDAVNLLVGGRVFAEAGHDPRDYGADGCASDGEAAVNLAVDLVGR
jgi:methanogenic corrinoid protein MtbC1